MARLTDRWRFVLDETGRRELEAARIASDERTRLALNQMRRVEDVMPGFEGHAYLDISSDVDGVTVLVRIYDPEYRPVGDEFSADV